MNFFRLFNNLPLYSITWLTLGLILLIIGGYELYKWRAYVLSVGLFSIGLGFISFALTRGFTDFSPEGRLLSKTGILTFLIGLPLIGYSIFLMI